MNRLTATVAALFIAAGSGFASAYETQTHALITRMAYERSVLAKTDGNSIAKRLGFDRLHPNDPFKPYWLPEAEALYYPIGSDFAEFIYLADAPANFERCQMRLFLELGQPRELFRNYFRNTVESAGQTPLLPIQNWLIRGAIREDDMGDGLGQIGLMGSDCAWEWWNTIDDQPGRITRPFRHFFDPIYRLGLSVAGIGYPRSVDWALGYQDSFANPRSALTGAA
ncbi:MAG: hypothetical protein E6Q43_06350 [Dokdonella sp.]|nr:MAG: hypothetical protein EYC71_06615 [Gammaproteobacteria bacterium]TXI72625.1 MAG: hypothetical protein E6Q43_06350 [Dokdonella sp.]